MGACWHRPIRAALLMVLLLWHLLSIRTMGLFTASESDSVTQQWKVCIS